MPGRLVVLTGPSGVGKGTVVAELRRIWALSKMEFAIAMVAFAGVLLLGILKGVLLAAIISLLLLIRRAAQPHVARLGRVPGTRRLSDVERHPENESVPGALILRVDAGLVYFNTGHVRDRVRSLLAASGDGLKLVVWDLSTSPNVDLAGARLVGDIQREVAARGAALRIVDAHSQVRDLVRKAVGESVGEVSRRISIEDVLAETAPR